MAKQTASSTAGGGSSTVAERKERSELVRILTGGKKKKKKKKKGPFWEQIWFLAVCLLVLLGGVTWAMWPLSDEQKFARAEELMRNPDRWTEARSNYLDALVVNSDGPFASRAQDYIDQIEMDQADRQAMNTRRNPEDRPEGERLYIRARKLEDVPDRISALRQYRSMVEILDPEKYRPYVNLARKKIAEIESSSDQPKQTTDVVNDALKRADDAATAGNPIRAEEIWSSIVTLYSDNIELEPQVRYARARLRNEKIEPIDFSKPLNSAKKKSPDESSDAKRESDTEPDAKPESDAKSDPADEKAPAEPAAAEPPAKDE